MSDKYLDDYHPKDIDQATFDPTDLDGIKAPFLYYLAALQVLEKHITYPHIFILWSKIKTFENCTSFHQRTTTITGISIILTLRKIYVRT